MRLIDADALKKNTRYLFRHADSALSEMEAVRACTAAQIDDAPTIDAASAVAVVKCSDCKHLGIKDFVYGYCKLNMCGIVMPNDYCSDGEKMEDKS